MPSKMTKEERAEYQREYRARKRADGRFATSAAADHPLTAVPEVYVANQQARIAELEAEVKRLKRELAGRRLDRGSAEFVRKTADLTDEQVETRVKAIVQDVRGGFGAPRPAPKPVSRKR